MASLFRTTCDGSVNRALEAPSVAFVLVGATNGIRDFKQFHEFVLDVYGAASTSSALFALVKPTDFDGSWYNEDAKHWLLRSLVGREGLVPGTQRILNSDEPFARHENVSAAIYHKLYAHEEDYRGNAALATSVRHRIAYWWGSLAMAWDMVHEYEAQRHRHFDQVIVARADLQYIRAIGPWPCYSNSTWYTSIDPPDAFWLMPRHSAARALPTIREVEREEAPPTGWQFSWFIACSWAHRLWPTGLRLAPLPELHGYARTHAAGSARPVAKHFGSEEVDADAAAHRPRPRAEGGGPYEVACAPYCVGCKS